MKVERQCIITAEQSQGDKTPIKCRLRRSKISETERKVKKIKNRRLSSCDTPLNFTTASPIIDKLKNKLSLAQVTSPSQCYVKLQRLRLSKLGLDTNITLPSSQIDTSKVRNCDITESDILKHSVDVHTRKYVVHPRFFNDISNFDETNDSGGEIEDTLNSTFTLSPNEQNLTHIDKKEDQSDAQAPPDRKRTFDKTEISINSNLNDGEKSKNFNNITIRNTFISIDDSSNDAEYLSPNKRRLTFDKSEIDVNNISKQNCKETSGEDDSFASCYDENLRNDLEIARKKCNFIDIDGNADVISLSSNRDIVVDECSAPVAVVDRSLNFDKDDIKDTKGSSKTNSGSNAAGTATVNFRSSNLKQQTLTDSASAANRDTSPPVTLKVNDFRIINKRCALEAESQRPSIMKKLSKVKKPKNELEKLSCISKTISKSSHLSSLARTPTISGSKAVQLYAFLSSETHKDSSTSPSSDTMTQDSLILGNSPRSSSTPKILKNHVVNSLLKSTLKKHRSNVAASDRSNNTNVMKKVTLGKMPNFASLHKKQFDKMENISDYKERKKERAKLLLSGSKPLNDTLLRPANKNIAKTLLMDSLDQSKLTQETKANSNVVLPDIFQSVCADNKENDDKVDVSDNKMLQRSKKKVTINVSPETPDRELSAMLVRKTPFKITSSYETAADELQLLKDMEKSNPQILRLDKPRTIATNSNDKTKLLANPTNLQAKSKKNVNNNGNVAKMALLKTTNSVLTENSKTKQRTAVTAYGLCSKSAVVGAKDKIGLTRFGFTVPVKLKKDDAVKTITSKARIPKDGQQEEKRSVIKGVRSNRRFDLLMQMRNKK